MAQILLATSTPTPSLGKKVAGGSSRQLPVAIQSLSVSMPANLRRRGENGDKATSKTGDKGRAPGTPGTGRRAGGPRAPLGSPACGSVPSPRVESAPPAMAMTETQTDQPPRGHVRVIYLGPVAPHWDVQGESEVRGLVDEFRARVLARLLLLPRTTRSSGATGRARRP